MSGGGDLVVISFQTIFDAHDTSGDGMISMDEFLSAMANTAQPVHQ